MIKLKTRRKFSAEEKIRIVLEGLRGEETIAAIYGFEKDLALPQSRSSHI